MKTSLLADATRIVLFIICMLSMLNANADTGINAVGDHRQKVETVRNLIERITPGFSEQFDIEFSPERTDKKDYFTVYQKDGKVLLRGNNIVSVATAFNHYLKYVCNAHLSWFGDQLDLPAKLPLPASATTHVIDAARRVYMNYCTFSYTASWWNWDRWQRELDYMAMNAINTPLSMVGLEGVWYNTLLKHGFSDEEIRGFLTGPAHFAWQWMQNIQSYGGPLPMSWINSHIELGKKINARMIELDMQPIQQGFSGYVPRELATKYPEAKIRQQPSWCGFQGAAQLDPTDPLFQIIGRDFLEEQKKLFGAHGLYAADPFHESRPPVDTPEYLSEVGRSIHNLFQSFDSNAVWIMQAWSLREPIVKAVPKSALIILDLDGSKGSNKNEYFWGYPSVAGNLHNFGGRINLHGDLELIASNRFATTSRKSGSTIGSGLFMESIEQNPVFYDLAFEMAIHPDSIDLDQWLANYARRRYGHRSVSAERAWKLLRSSAYSRGTNGVEYSSIVAARPALDVKKSGPNAGFSIPYNTHTLVEAQALLLADTAILGNSTPYRFDIVDLQRQIMSNLGQRIHKRAASAFRNKDRKEFRKHSELFLELLSDMDTLLRTRREFNFDRWLETARSWGSNEDEKNLYEKEATALVTIWGGDGDPLIFDYGWKEWSGLIAGYYRKRWEAFYNMLDSCLVENREYSEEGIKQTHGREALRANNFYNSLADWELNYVDTPGKLRSPVTMGDEIEVVTRLFMKYNCIAEDYSDENTLSTPQAKKLYLNLGEKDV